MDEFEDEPRSLPCSAEEAKYMPVMVQLHLVDAALEQLPPPREDFYRQYSVTPERQTPEGERTPQFPTYDREAYLKAEKKYALDISETLGKFHAGRLLLRKEETEDRGTVEEDRDYWILKGAYWQDELWDLLQETGRRKKLELKGEAEEGYALAMLSSPLQSPSLLPMDGSLPEVAQQSKTSNEVGEEGPGTGTRSSQIDAASLQGPPQTEPPQNSHHLSRSTKGQKRKFTDGDDHEEESSDQIRRTKRRPRAAEQAQGPIPTTETTRDLGRNTPKASKTKAKVRPGRKNISKTSSAPRSLPWKLRPRGALSNRETGVKTKA